jgi:ABC-type transporter Mla maintaining outer membrane lipid asymmetry ATPase subunit MlaF
MAADEPVIAVSDLTRRFGARAVLSSVTLEISRGGVYGLVGANGAGTGVLALRRDLSLASTTSC